MARKLSTAPFFNGSDLNLTRATEIVQNGLHGTDYGEFFHQIKASEAIQKSSGILSASLGSRSAGFGFRAGQGERQGYSYSDQFNEAALRNAISQSRSILTHNNGTVSVPLGGFGRTKDNMHPVQDTLGDMSVEEKISNINTIDDYMRSMHSNIRNASISYQASMEQIHIITPDGQSLTDYRPRFMLGLNLLLEGENGQMEQGGYAFSTRVSAQELFNPVNWQAGAQDALHTAQELLRADTAPAGEMDVVMGPGWSAVLLHEAVGHGLEGDFNRKASSVYSGKIGQQVAAKGVTIIDQGDMPGERGSIPFDDEGTPTQKNVLIEDGVLKGYMQDRQNAMLMGVALTGNGRRETFRHLPMPRMTNTYFDNGQYSHDEIIASTKDGIYVDKMGGGQVDITNGKFNMNATLAYRIRDGKLCEPLKGAALVSDGLATIQNIDMVGDNLEIEKHAGNCGKNGQWVPVSCGQPSVRTKKMTIGGVK